MIDFIYMWKKGHHRKMGTKMIIVYMMSALVIFAAGAFFGKVKVYHKIKAGDGYGAWQHRSSEDGKSGYQNFREAERADHAMGKGVGSRGTFDGDMTVVEVMAMDPSGMTVKSGDGMTVIRISTDTRIIRLPEGDLSGLRVGDMVTVIGTIGDDGVVDAERIHVRP